VDRESIFDSPLKNVRIGIDYSDDRAIRWRLVAFEWERSLFSSTPKDKFALTGPDRIEGDHRAAFWLEIGIERLDDQHFAPVESLVLNAGDNRSNDAGDLHY